MNISFIWILNDQLLLWGFILGSKYIWNKTINDCDVSWLLLKTWRVWNNNNMNRKTNELNTTNIAWGNITQNLIYIDFYFCVCFFLKCCFVASVYEQMRTIISFLFFAFVTVICGSYDHWCKSYSWWCLFTIMFLINCIDISARFTIIIFLHDTLLHLYYEY